MKKQKGSSLIELVLWMTIAGTIAGGTIAKMPELTAWAHEYNEKRQVKFDEIKLITEGK